MSLSGDTGDHTCACAETRADNAKLYLITRAVGVKVRHNNTESALFFKKRKQCILKKLHR